MTPPEGGRMRIPVIGLALALVSGFGIGSTAGRAESCASDEALRLVRGRRRARREGEKRSEGRPGPARSAYRAARALQREPGVSGRRGERGSPRKGGGAVFRGGRRRDDGHRRQAHGARRGPTPRISAAPASRAASRGISRKATSSWCRRTRRTGSAPSTGRSR